MELVMSFDRMDQKGSQECSKNYTNQEWLSTPQNEQKLATSEY